MPAIKQQSKPAPIEQPKPAPIEPDFKKSAAKYSNKITKHIESKMEQKQTNTFIFTQQSKEKIIKIIKHYDFLITTLQPDDVNKYYNYEGEPQINIMLGNSSYLFSVYMNTLINRNDMSMILKMEKLFSNISNKLKKENVSFDIINLIKSDSDDSDESDNAYINIIKNAAVLGYIFIKKLNKNIQFNSLKKLHPFIKSIIEMTYSVNSIQIPIDEDPKNDDNDNEDEDNEDKYIY